MTLGTCPDQGWQTGKVWTWITRYMQMGVWSCHILWESGIWHEPGPLWGLPTLAFKFACKFDILANNLPSSGCSTSISASDTLAKTVSNWVGIGGVVPWAWTVWHVQITSLVMCFVTWGAGGICMVRHLKTGSWVLGKTSSVEREMDACQIM